MFVDRWEIGEDSDERGKLIFDTFNINEKCGISQNFPTHPTPWQFPSILFHSLLCSSHWLLVLMSTVSSPPTEQCRLLMITCLIFTPPLDTSQHRETVLLMVGDYVKGRLPSAYCRLEMAFAMFLPISRTFLWQFCKRAWKAFCMYHVQTFVICQ